jgi:hypothetical protein
MRSSEPTTPDAALQDAGEADGGPVVRADDADLGVERDELDTLREVLLHVVGAARGADLLDARLDAREHDRDGDAEGEEVGDAQVELEGALERVREQVLGVRPVLALGEGHDAVAVVEEQPEAEVEVTDDVRAVDRDEALGVDRRTEQVRVGAAVRVRERLGGSVLGLRLGCGESHGSDESGGPDGEGERAQSTARSHVRLLRRGLPVPAQRQIKVRFGA